jgi:hypothetical protein
LGRKKRMSGRRIWNVLKGTQSMRVCVVVVFLLFCCSCVCVAVSTGLMNALRGSSERAGFFYDDCRPIIRQ